MRHHCSRCSSEFFDDSPSSSPPTRVFCVFCGAPIPTEDDEGPRRVPFGADLAREDASALGVIGSARSDFPDTLKQFRASGRHVSERSDSLSPTQSGPDQAPPPADGDDGQVARFWASLAVGLGVGAVAAAMLSERESEPKSPASARAASPLVQTVSPAILLSGCPAGGAAPQPAVAPPHASAPPPTVSGTSPSGKVVVTPVLERRFWLERARTAQREYRLADAERYYRRVLSLSARDSEALAGVGELALLRGAPSDAESRFREALEANPNYLPALVGLADLHWESGQADAARREYASIVERYSDDVYPPYIKQRMEEDACVPQCR